MLEATIFSYSNLFDGVVRETNANPYDKKLTQEQPVAEYDREPYFIYFYYLKFGSEGCIEISHYEWLNPTPIAHSDVKEHIERLARNARAGGANPPKSGARFENIIWRRISYIAILMDNPNWTLLRRVPGQQACLGFNVTKTETGNHSFFDAADVDVNVAALGEAPVWRRAVYMVNHMKKDSDGAELAYLQDGVTPESQKFAFDVVFDVRDCAGAGSCPFIIDPDGTNLGPPLPPP